MVTTHSLKAGESLTVSGTVKVIRCGSYSEGDGPAVPIVNLEVETEDVRLAEGSPETESQSAFVPADAALSMEQ